MDNDQQTNEQPGLAAQSGPACIHDDIMTMRNLALQVKAHPHQRAAAAGFEALARIVDDLAHRLDAIEAAAAQALHPCEGCGGINAEQLAVIEAGDKAQAKGGALRRALEVAGIVKGGA